MKTDTNISEIHFICLASLVQICFLFTKIILNQLFHKEFKVKETRD